MGKHLREQNQLMQRPCGQKKLGVLEEQQEREWLVCNKQAKKGEETGLKRKEGQGM